MIADFISPFSFPDEPKAASSPQQDAPPFSGAGFAS